MGKERLAFSGENAQRMQKARFAGTTGPFYLNKLYIINNLDCMAVDAVWFEPLSILHSR
jgi:hypothetical protein